MLSLACGVPADTESPSERAGDPLDPSQRPCSTARPPAPTRAQRPNPILTPGLGRAQLQVDRTRPRAHKICSEVHPRPLGDVPSGAGSCQHRSGWWRAAKVTVKTLGDIPTWHRDSAAGCPEGHTAADPPRRGGSRHGDSSWWQHPPRGPDEPGPKPLLWCTEPPPEAPGASHKQPGAPRLLPSAVPHPHAAPARTKPGSEPPPKPHHSLSPGLLRLSSAPSHGRAPVPPAPL